MRLKELDLIYNRNKPTPYNFTDVIRVNKGAIIVNNMLKESLYFTQIDESTFKMEWNFKDFPTVKEITDFLDNIKKIRNVYYQSIDLTLPEDMRIANYSGLNDIEHLLENTEMLVLNMKNLYQYTGDFLSGQSMLFPNSFYYDKVEITRYLGTFYCGEIK